MGFTRAFGVVAVGRNFSLLDESNIGGAVDLDIEWKGRQKKLGHGADETGEGEVGMVDRPENVLSVSEYYHSPPGDSRRSKMRCFFLRFSENSFICCCILDL